MSQIHPTAIVDPGAKIAEDCTIGAYSIIGPQVSLGRGARVGPHVVIEGHTTLGEGNVVFQFASLGAVPQDLKYQGEDSQLIVGNGNIIREYVTLQPGTSGGGMKTVIGDKNLFMAGSHVGHDGIIGSHNIFANFCGMAGHVVVGNRVTIGGMAGVHQFVRLGDLSFLGAGAMVGKDVPPYCMVHGDHAQLIGLNQVGLKRAGFSAEQIMQLKKIYREAFWSSGKFSERLARARELAEGLEAGKLLIQFLSEQTSRGITPARRGAENPTSADQ